MIQLNQLRAYEKVIRISQPNIRKSVTSPISNIRIETPAKVNITGRTNNVCKVSNKVYLSKLIGFCLNHILLSLVIHFTQT